MERLFVFIIFFIGYHHVQANDNVVQNDFVHLKADSRDLKNRKYTGASTEAITQYAADYNDALAGSEEALRSCPACSCGMQNKRIVGSQTITANNYPWVGYMTYYGKLYCGATLINSKYGMTAGHCTQGYELAQVKVRFGQYKRGTKKGVERKVILAMRPKNFDINTLNNDISLIKFDKAIAFGSELKPVCLPTDTTHSYQHIQGRILGWGDPLQDGKPSLTLKATDLPIIDQKTCERLYARNMYPSMMCTLQFPGNEVDCQSDSGSPLVVHNSEIRFTQVGIMSWGNRCSKRNIPGVFARVTNLMKFIQANTDDGCYCKN